MNIDNSNKEQSINLGLALGNSSQCIQKALNDDSGAGAGANAGSNVDTTFVATDPLSELVWSPHKGLSLKCADSSMNAERPSVLWGAGPNNKIHSPPQDIVVRKIISKEPTGEGNLITSQGTTLHTKNEMGETYNLTCSPGSNAGIKTVYGSSHELNAGTSGNNDKFLVAPEISQLEFNQEQDQGDNKEKGIYFPIDIRMAVTSAAGGRQVSGSLGLELGSVADSRSFKMNETEPGMARTEALPMPLKKMTFSNPYNGVGNNGGHNKALGMEVILTTTEVPLPKQCNTPDTPDTPVLNSTSPSRRDEAFALAIEEEISNEVKTPGSTSAPLEKPESAAENDLRTQTGENVCGALSKIMTTASDYNVKIISQKDAGMLRKAKAFPVNNFPNKCAIYRHRRKGKGKGKGKALSDGDHSGRRSKKEDDSDESVESCNSAACSTGKRKRGFEQQLMTGSKRIRKEINESPGATSFVRHDSSFMSWISNMMKGLPKSNQDETPSVALTLAHANHDSHDQKLVTCNRYQDPGSRNMGFQSIFQSLCCPTTKVQESRSSSANDGTGEESKELYLASKPCDNIMSMACHGENNSFKKALLWNEKFNRSTFGNGAGPSIRPVENRSASNPVCSTRKDEVTSSSLGKQKINSPDNNDSDPPSVGKTTNNFDYRSDLLGSPWLTRFSPKTSSPTLKVDQCNQKAGEYTELSSDCMGLIPYSQNHFDSLKGLKIVETREYCTEEPLTIVGADPHNYSGGTEVSFGFKKHNSQNNKKSTYKFNPVLPSQRFKSSEAMTSLFARRLDALKHIRAWNETDNEARPTPTCFFCGIRGHSIHDCSDIKEIELENLLRNNTSYTGAEEPPCFCIRCFQHNHWAVACPSVSKSRNQSECGASLVNRCSAGLKLYDTGEKRNWELWKGRENQPQVAAAFEFCSGKRQTMQTSCSLNEKGNGNMTLFSNSILVKKYTASSSGEIDSKESQIIPFCNFFSSQTTDAPKGIFDAIKRLRLSRGDILKWMSSVFPFSHLNGFFLRLRLGKWEEELGGTGYHVACISGAQKERLPQSSKTPIAVNIGGVKCLVESQYVSNNDFLEDELMAWWGATTRAGGKIPSEEDLKAKLEEKKRLGF